MRPRRVRGLALGSWLLITVKVISGQDLFMCDLGFWLKECRTQRFKLPRSAPRDYLELNSGIFYGYVACFGYGQDLYIGWTYWSKLSPIRYVFIFFARLWQSLFNRGSDLYVSLRFDSARALRKTMHRATRQGVDVAVGRLEAQGQGIIGSAIPVTEHAGTE